MPARTRLESQRELSEIVDRRLKRNPRIEKLRPPIRFAYQGVLEKMIGKTAGVGHQIAERDRARGIDQTAVDRQYLEPRERWNELRDGCGSEPFPDPSRRRSASGPTPIHRLGSRLTEPDLSAIR